MLLIIGVVLANVRTDEIMSKLKLKEDDLKSQMKQAKTVIPRFRIQHLINEIERKKASIVIYNQLQEEVSKKQKELQEMRGLLKDRKECVSAEEQHRMDIMRDSMYRKNNKLKMVQEKSDEMMKTIVEPSFVESLAEHLELKTKELTKQKEDTRRKILAERANVSKFKSQLVELNGKLRNTVVGALKLFYEDMKVDLVNQLQKSVTRLRQLKTLGEDIEKNLKDERKQFVKKIEYHEDEKIEETVQTMKETKKQLKIYLDKGTNC